MSQPRIVIAGAGSIGCYVGGRLVAAGRDVRFLARPHIAAELGMHGLTLTDRDGGHVHLPAAQLRVGTDAALLADADVVLVTVKSAATVEMARTIAAAAPLRAAVVSLQNGVGNTALLRDALPAMQVAAGMVPFNVAALGNGRFHRGTDGTIVIDARAAALAQALSVPQMPVTTHADMHAVAWGKLLLNLNNALNALAGVPLREELADRRWRRVFAACIDEALAALRAASIRPAKVGVLPPPALPFVLRLPDAIFRLVAAAQLKIDPTARSSMWDDLEHRRLTEIDELQGAVVALASAHGLGAPMNAAVRDRIREAERAGAGSPRTAAAELHVP